MRDAIAPGARIGRARRLPGGIAQGMHAFDIVAPDGTRLPLVIRRYRPEKLRRRPDVAAWEHRVLELLRALDLPAPRPVWHDERTLVMTRLPGRSWIAPRDVANWARRLGRTLAWIHDAQLAGRDVSFLRDQSWLDEVLGERPPENGVADWRAVWAAMRTLRPRTTPRELVHGDFWSGNTLWRRARLVGVVDWDGCQVGDGGWDVGNCRVDLAMAQGGDAADVFLRAYEDARSAPMRDRAFWDLVATSAAAPDPIQWLSGLHDLGRTDLTADLMRTRLRAFIAAALQTSAANPSS